VGAATGRLKTATLPHPRPAARAPLSATRDGLTDTWPGDETPAGRWWWHVRDAAGRRLANVRLARRRAARTVQPRTLLGLLIALGIVLAVSGAGLLLALRYAGSISLPIFGDSAAQPTTGIVFQNNPGGTAPIIAVPPIALAAWPSDSGPSSDGHVQIFVRVTSTTTFAAQPGVGVSLAIAYTCATGGDVQRYGPTATDGDGLAIFAVTFANLPIGQPACITASATVGGHTYTTTATFAAAGGGISPTPDGPWPTPTPRPKKHHGLPPLPE
jgi:hypothetical protein